MATAPILEPNEKTNFKLESGQEFKKGMEYDLRVVINPEGNKQATFGGKVSPTDKRNLHTLDNYLCN